jgi:hypothetical protein
MLKRTQEVACQQVLVEDNSVFSIQWSVFPEALAAGMTPELLAQRYLKYIRSCTWSVIRPCFGDNGLELRLLNSRLSLISFLPPVHGETSLLLRICGGLLVQPRQCHRGELRFEVTAMEEGTRVSLQLSDYCPLLLGSSTPTLFNHWFYRLTQAAIHRLVTVRFLVLLYRELAGSASPVRVVTVSIREGRAI